MTELSHESAMTLRKRLRSMRLEQGLSQEELSRRLYGHTGQQSRISRLEKDATFTFQEIHECARVLGRDFLNGVGLPYVDVNVAGVTAEAQIARDDLAALFAEVAEARPGE